MDQGRSGMDEGGGTVQNTLKRGGTVKMGGETKILKRGWQASSRGRCLRKGGAETPSQTMGGGAKIPRLPSHRLGLGPLMFLRYINDLQSPFLKSVTHHTNLSFLGKKL